MVVEGAGAGERGSGRVAAGAQEHQGRVGQQGQGAGGDEVAARRTQPHDVDAGRSVHGGAQPAVEGVVDDPVEPVEPDEPVEPVEPVEPPDDEPVEPPEVNDEPAPDGVVVSVDP